MGEDRTIVTKEMLFAARLEIDVCLIDWDGSTPSEKEHALLKACISLLSSSKDPDIISAGRRLSNACFAE